MTPFHVIILYKITELTGNVLNRDVYVHYIKWHIRIWDFQHIAHPELNQQNLFMQKHEIHLKKIAKQESVSKISKHVKKISTNKRQIVLLEAVQTCFFRSLQICCSTMVISLSTRSMFWISSSLEKRAGTRSKSGSIWTGLTGEIGSSFPMAFPRSCRSKAVRKDAYLDVKDVYTITDLFVFSFTRTKVKQSMNLTNWKGRMRTSLRGISCGKSGPSLVWIYLITGGRSVWDIWHITAKGWKSPVISRIDSIWFTRSWFNSNLNSNHFDSVSIG